MSQSGCKWNRKKIGENEYESQCIDDIKLTKENGEKKAEMILALNDGGGGDRHNYNCFDSNGDYQGPSENLCEIAYSDMPGIRGVYRSRIDEAFSLIASDCKDEQTCIENCIPAESVDIHGGQNYNCPIDNTSCVGPNGDSGVHPKFGAPDFPCSDGACLVRNENLSSFYQKDFGGETKYKIMSPDKRQCENRTPEECEKVLNEMQLHGLERGKNKLKVYLMCEIPSNVIEADVFSQYVDGVSIGGNDLLQLTLGVDRDSDKISYLTNHENLSYRRMIQKSIETYKKYGVKVGFCGQQPSDSIEFCEFLVKSGIDSISVTSDSVIKTYSQFI